MITLKEGEAINFDTGEVEKIDPPKEQKADADAAKTEEKGTEKDDTPTDKKEEESKKEPVAEGKKEEEEKESEEESEQESDQEEGEEEEEGEEKKEPETEKEEEEVVGVDSWLAEKYADREINSEEDLDAVLETIDEIQKENEDLKAERDELKKAKPKFDSEAEEKAYNFVKQFGVDRLGEGMQTYANLITMDVEKAEPKILLEEQFILENPDLTREEALRKFNRDYNRRYVVQRDDYEDDNLFKEAQEDRRIDLKADAAKAKKFIQQKQAEFKPKAKDTENKEPKNSEAIQKSIKAHDSELEGFIKEFDSLVFSPTDNEKDDFVFKLTKPQIKEVQAAYQGWIRNPNSYDAKGNLIGFTDIDNKVHQISYMLFGPDLIEKALKHGLSKGEIKRAEEIAKKKPNRTSKVASTAPDVSEEKQWEEIVKQKKSGKVFA